MTKITRIKQHVKRNAVEYALFAMSATLVGVAIYRYKTNSPDVDFIELTLDMFERMNDGEALIIRNKIGVFCVHSVDL